MVMWSWFLIIEIVASICLAVFARGILLFVRRRQRLRTYFRGKHVWVTGASSGIGLEVSKLVAEYGARVTLSARSIDKLEAIVRECTSRGNEVFSVPMDIAGTYEEVEKAYQAAIAHFGPVDVLIANAGINNGGKKFLDLNPVIVESVISTNFRGTVYSTMAVAKDMVERGRGTIAGVSSLAAYRGLPRGSVYGGTKAAITNFLEAIRVELYSTGVKVKQKCNEMKHCFVLPYEKKETDRTKAEIGC